MPNSLVTIGAEVGENIYTVSHNEADPVYSLTLDNDYAALFDSRVQFKVNFVSNDYEVESVIVDNNTLSPSSTGVYSFMMPAYPVEIEVNYNKVYKEFTVVNSNHYGAELKTYDDTNTLIQVTNNNVISNQDVEVHLSPLNVDSDKFLVNGLTILAGNKSDALAEANIAISKTDYGYKFTTSDEYRYYSLQLSETEKTSLMGTFKGGSPNDQYASVTTLSFENGVVSGEEWGTPYSAAYEFDGNVYSYNVVGKYSTNYFKFWTNAANNAILHFSYASDFGSGISANYRHQNTRLLFPSSLSIESYYSIITYGNASNGYSTEYFKQYYEYKLSDGSVVTCFIDFETDKVTWDVKLELLSGENGLTTGDVVEIKDGSDNTLAKMKIDSKSKSHKQYYAKDAA